MAPEDAKREQLNVRVSRRTRNQLRAVSEIKDKTLNELAEEAIQLLVKKYTREKGWSAKYEAWVQEQHELMASLED